MASHSIVEIVVLLAAVMLLGRLTPLAVLWWMARTTPSEVLVG